MFPSSRPARRLALGFAALSAATASLTGVVALAGPSLAGPITVQQQPTAQVDNRVYTLTDFNGQLAGGVAYDHEGNLFVARSGAILRVAATDHHITTVVSTSALAAAVPNCTANNADAVELAVDPSDHLHASLPGCGRVVRVSPGGSVTVVAGGGSSTAGSVPALDKHLEFPYGIAFDGAGSLYVTDRIYVYRVSGGQLTTVAGTGVDGYNGDGIPATAAELHAVLSVAVDPTGAVLVGEDGRLRRFTPGGPISTVAGDGVVATSGDGGPAAAAEVSVVLGILVDPSGTILFSDASGNRIRQVSTGGTISTSIGGTPSPFFNGDGLRPLETAIWFPHGLARNPTNGRLAFVDENNHRLRQLRPFSILQIPAG